MLWTVAYILRSLFKCFNSIKVTLVTLARRAKRGRPEEIGTMLREWPFFRGVSCKVWDCRDGSHGRWLVLTDLKQGVCIYSCSVGRLTAP